jgi:flagellar L-ring protein precursor FlgH
MLLPFTLLIAATALSACTSGRPTFTPAEVSLLNAKQNDIGKLMPTTKVDTTRAPGALWMSGSRDFFRDNRARQVGDIITVVVSVNASGTTAANTATEATQNIGVGVGRLFDFTDILQRQNLEAGPTAATNGLIDLDTNREFEGTGSTNRSDRMAARVAAIVTDVLPNGYLVINGQQEVILNYELQELTVSGVVRPEDVTAGNTISSDKIAQARISYAGRGVVDRSQGPKLVPRLIDELSPF